MTPFPLVRQVVMSGTSRDNLNDLSDDFVKKFKPKEREIIIEAFLQTDFRTCGTQSPRPLTIVPLKLLQQNHVCILFLRWTEF
jgi:hypothetical protein